MIAFSGCANNPSGAFLIISDEAAYRELQPELTQYGEILLGEAYQVEYLHKDWPSPSELKDTLKQIYAKKGIEGVVFVGDIPIPMIRGAQHLASAFKMDEDRFSNFRSSIPSDRFYDDLDLKFTFIEHDTLHPLCSYYQFSADSPQRIDKEFYSARMYPGADGSLADIRNYLKKVIRIRQQEHLLDSVLVFSGHGYHSESLTAWESQSFAMVHMFPQLGEPGGHYSNYYHSMDSEMKTILSNRLSESWDMAIFHAHGADDTQYLLGFPPAANTAENIESVKMYLRSKMRQAISWKRNPDDVKAGFIKSLGVPESWFDGSFDKDMITADSIYSVNLDLQVADLKKLTLNPNLFVFDECFNGSFHQPEYVAGVYLFGPGNMIVGIANTVNVKQDIWPLELMEMLNFGKSIGEWHKVNRFIESHLLGDPTFHYTATKVTPRWLKRFPKLYLKNPDPAIRALALHYFYAAHPEASRPALVKMALTDEDMLVRLEAARSLAEGRSHTFYQILPELMNDSYELTRRFAVHWAGHSGLPEMIAPIVQRLMKDPSERVQYAAGDALDIIGYQTAADETERVFAAMIMNEGTTAKAKRIVDGIRHNELMVNKEVLAALTSDTLTTKETVNNIRHLRNYPFIEAREALMQFCADTTRKETQRVIALEALGWYHMHYEWEEMAEFAKTIADDPGQPQAVREEALISYKRLLIGPNQPVSP